MIQKRPINHGNLGRYHLTQVTVIMVMVASNGYEAGDDFIVHEITFDLRAVMP